MRLPTKDEQVCVTFLLYLMPEIDGEPNEHYDVAKAGWLYKKHKCLIDSMLRTFAAISSGSAFREAMDGIKHVA
jgi:hypothetical protein